MQRTARRRSLLSPLIAFGVALGCQGILGIEDGKPRADGDGGRPCLLDSQCEGDEVCLFKVCSPECDADKDCPTGRCLKTDDSIGCVTASQAQCPAQSCPSGTVCIQGQCRTSCESGGTNRCRQDQTCLKGVCVGRDPEHDPIEDAGSSAGGRGAGGATGGSDAGEDAATDASDGATEAAAGGSGSGGRPPGGNGGSSGNDGGGDTCIGVECNEQPDDDCADNDTKRTYDPVGSCQDGVCEYAFTDTDCAFGCSAGVCNEDPCTGVACTKPPKNYCQDSEHLLAYDTTGTCQEGDCVFSSQVVTCTCRDDACTTDPCETVTCDNPPPPTCFNANTRRTFAAAGTCSGGSCSYGHTDTNCPFGCENGSCKPNPCNGVTCDSPPAASCPDSTTLKTYAAMGTCSGGSCTYASSETSCTMMCTIAGTADCRCAPGYSGSGVGPGGCTDINECATNNGGCGNATYWKCTNNVGAPPTCSDINECATNNGGCGSATYWKCTNNVGAPPTCSDINECSLNTDDCDTSPMATCKNVAGGFNCTCPSPYVGNGHGSGGCTCPTVAACDAAGEQNGSYCSNSTTRVTCSNSNGCQIASTMMCKDVANEMCVGMHPNAQCEKVAGNATDGGGSGNLGAAFLFAVPLNVTESLTLTRIGLIARSASSGVRLAVYEGSTGPTTWKASALGGTIAAGRNEYPINDPPISAPVTLAPGSYWIVVVVQAATEFAQGAVTSVRYRAWSPWNSPFPTGTLAPVTSDSLAALNLYVVGIP